MNTVSTKPLLRGHFHQSAFFFVLGVSCLLITECTDPKKIFAVTIYTLGLNFLFGISALYHRPNWQPHLRQWMRRLDHSSIFVFIAATGTPIFLLTMTEEMGNSLLTLTWSFALLGILQSLFWIRAPKWVTALLCISAGWIIIPYMSELKAALGARNLAYLLGGGIIYSLGAIIYAVKRPNPFPRYFGHHEIFHIAVILGAFLHFLVVYPLIKCH